MNKRLLLLTIISIVAIQLQAGPEPGHAETRPNPIERREFRERGAHEENAQRARDAQASMHAIAAQHERNVHGDRPAGSKADQERSGRRVKDGSEVKGLSIGFAREVGTKGLFGGDSSAAQGLRKEFLKQGVSERAANEYIKEIQDIVKNKKGIGQWLSDLVKSAGNGIASLGQALARGAQSLKFWGKSSSRSSLPDVPENPNMQAIREVMVANGINDELFKATRATDQDDIFDQQPKNRQRAKAILDSLKDIQENVSSRTITKAEAQILIAEMKEKIAPYLEEPFGRSRDEDGNLMTLGTILKRIIEKNGFNKDITASLPIETQRNLNVAVQLIESRKIDATVDEVIQAVNELYAKNTNPSDRALISSVLIDSFANQASSRNRAILEGLPKGSSPYEALKGILQSYDRAQSLTERGRSLPPSSTRTLSRASREAGSGFQPVSNYTGEVESTGRAETV